MEDKIHQQRWGEERMPGKSFLALESDESDQPRKKRKKIISSSEYITKKQENQRKKKLLESLDPQEYLTLQSLVIIIFNNLTKFQWWESIYDYAFQLTTASTIKTNVVAAQRLVAVDTAFHETAGGKGKSVFLEACILVNKNLYIPRWRRPRSNARNTRGAIEARLGPGIAITAPFIYENWLPSIYLASEWTKS